MADKPWLTFDCYDTLVRYTESKSAALEELIRQKNGDEKKYKKPKQFLKKQSESFS